jgi:hypothetical protein
MLNKSVYFLLRQNEMCANKEKSGQNMNRKKKEKEKKSDTKKSKLRNKNALIVPAPGMQTNPS